MKEIIHNFPNFKNVYILLKNLFFFSYLLRKIILLIFYDNLFFSVRLMLEIFLNFNYIYNRIDQKTNLSAREAAKVNHQILQCRKI